MLDKFRKFPGQIDLNFPPKKGTGIAKLMSHVSPDCMDLICKLLEYDPDERISAREALNHPCFKEIRDEEKMAKTAQPGLSSRFQATLKTSYDGSLSDHSDTEGTTKNFGSKKGSLPINTSAKNLKSYESGFNSKLLLPNKDANTFYYHTTIGEKTSKKMKLNPQLPPISNSIYNSKSIKSDAKISNKKDNRNSHMFDKAVSDHRQTKLAGPTTLLKSQMNNSLDEDLKIDKATIFSKKFQEDYRKSMKQKSPYAVSYHK